MSDTLRAAAQTMLEAWQTASYGHPSHHKATLLAMTALRAALAEPDVPEVCFGNMSDTLPPLPEPAFLSCDYSLAWSVEKLAGWSKRDSAQYTVPLFTADQMRSYAAAALAAERERQHEQMRQLMSELIFDEPAAVAEPVASVTECEACFTPDVCQLRGTCDHYAAERLRVAAPPQREPLTDEQVDAMYSASYRTRESDYATNWYWYERGIREAERAHGITKEAP